MITVSWPPFERFTAQHFVLRVGVDGPGLGQPQHAGLHPELGAPADHLEELDPKHAGQLARP
jgi:hypothetical protein